MSDQAYDACETDDSDESGADGPKPAATSLEEDATSGDMHSSIRKLAQLIVKDQETGYEYMIADFGAPQNSSQKLVNLSTNETRVFQYNTLEEHERAQDLGFESLSAISTCATLSQAPSETASERRKKRAGKIWYWTSSCIRILACSDGRTAHRIFELP